MYEVLTAEVTVFDAYYDLAWSTTNGAVLTQTLNLIVTLVCCFELGFK